MRSEPFVAPGTEMAQLEVLALVSRITDGNGLKGRLWLSHPLAPLSIYFPNGS